MPSLYQLKKTLMKPYSAYRRRRAGDQDAFMQAALELHYYRPAFYRFIGAVVDNRDILHEGNFTPDTTVLDVGAYVGHWSRKMHRLHGCRIYAFEPNRATFETLCMESHGQWQSLPYGLSDRDEEVNLSLNGMGSSAFELGNTGKQPDYAPAQLRAVDAAWRELELGQVGLMKINIEGGEFPLLEKMIATDLLAQVDTYLIQFHEWHPGAYHRRRKIRRELAKTHRLVWDYHFVWERWERR